MHLAVPARRHWITLASAVSLALATAHQRWSPPRWFAADGDPEHHRRAEQSGSPGYSKVSRQFRTVA